MTNPQFNQEDQINFKGIKKIIFGLLQECFLFVEFAQLTIRRKIGFIIAGLLLGVLCAVFYYYNKPKVYRASMVVIFNRLNKKTYAEIINQLNVSITGSSDERLAEELNLPVPFVQDILYIESRNLNNEPLEQDTSSRTYQPFKIIVSLSVNKNADSLQSAILNYINNRPYFKSLSELDRQNNLARLKYIESDLAKLDTLKTEFNHFLASSRVSATIYNNAINPAEIYIQSNTLIGNRENVLRTLNVENKSVSLIDGFKITDSPQERSLLDLVTIIGGVGLLTGFLFGLLLETKKVVLPEHKK